MLGRGEMYKGLRCIGNGGRKGREKKGDRISETESAQRYRERRRSALAARKSIRTFPIVEFRDRAAKRTIVTFHLDRCDGSRTAPLQHRVAIDKIPSALPNG